MASASDMAASAGQTVGTLIGAVAAAQQVASMVQQLQGTQMPATPACISSAIAPAAVPSAVAPAPALLPQPVPQQPLLWQQQPPHLLPSVAANGTSQTVPPSLFADYERCLAALEHMIKGPLQRKKADILAAARAVEANMGTVTRAAERLQAEADKGAARVTERLQASKEQKLGVLRQHLASYLSDVDAIDSHVQHALGTAAEPPPGASAAGFAKILVEQQPELMAKAQRLLQRPVIQPPAVPTDDLPRDVKEQQGQLARLDALEMLLCVKDQVVGALIEEAHASRQRQAERNVYAQRAFSFVEAAQASSHGELLDWAATAQECSEWVDELQVALGASQQEVDQLREHNKQLSEQNELLRAHCEGVRRMVLTSTSAADPFAPAVPTQFSS